MIARMNEAEGRRALAQLENWTLCEGAAALVSEFQFGDFIEAFAFMTRVAMLAEKLDHHPEWSNVYGRVAIRLTTRDVGGISQRDFVLARAISDQASLLARTD